MTFRTYEPFANPQEASSASTKRRAKRNVSPATTGPAGQNLTAVVEPSLSSSSVTPSRARHRREDKKQNEAMEEREDEGVSWKGERAGGEEHKQDREKAHRYDDSRTIASRNRQDVPRTQELLVPASMDSSDGRYFSHFIDRLSTLLILDDSSVDRNPFRTLFPELSRSSPLMIDAMQAVAALHLANTSQAQQRIAHFQNAVSKYDGVVRSFRTRSNTSGQQLQLTDLAVCLLLCLFEMMDSQYHHWLVHLKGAKGIYRTLYYPNQAHHDYARAARRQPDSPTQNFLVSMLFYLDAAGACAASDGTVVVGSYWAFDGGSEFQAPGASSSCRGAAASHSSLAELRQCWCAMMEIQASVSAFGEAKQRWMPFEQQDQAYKCLLDRMAAWRANASEPLRRLAGLDGNSLQQYEYQDMIEHAGCVEAYEKATILYLHKILGAGRPDRQPDAVVVDALVGRILLLIEKLATGVRQLAVVWPLYVAGREARQEYQQQFVREKLMELQLYGFKNLEKGLQGLQGIWFKRRMFPGGWVETMDELRPPMVIQ
ncbi:hypothetical protein MAP00_004058 [Monascus purpureus]|nr:hypothetical protein MAP00_004058 [Monascus purpureus]